MSEHAERRLVERYRRARADPDAVVLEGFHALKHALRFGADVLDVRASSGTDLDRLAHELAPDLRATLSAAAMTVSPSVFERLAPQPPPTGVIALATRPTVGIDAILSSSAPAPVVLLDRPVHLGNLGAAIRVAAAAEAAGTITLGRHDPWQAEAVRGAAGLQFAIPVARADRLPPSGRSLIAIDPTGDPLDPAAIPARAVLCFGSERSGLDPGLLARAELRLRIPMRAGVSSLNLATAVAIVVYGWRMALPSR